MSSQSRRKARHESSSPSYTSPSKNGVTGSSRSGSASALLGTSSGRRRTTSTQGSRSTSPLHADVQTSPANSMSGYPMSHALMDVTALSPASRSPYQSPVNSRSSSMTSVKSLMRDREAVSRSLERNMSPSYEKPVEHSHRSLTTTGAKYRSLSRDRASDRYRDFEHYNTFSGRTRDRSLDRDRDYPHMGAMSLQRDQHTSNLVRSRSIDYDYVNSQAAFLPAPQDFPHNSDTLVLDLQTHIADLNKECAIYQQELDLTQEKLASSMNSIKTFWSPELKKERALRKDESAKIGSLSEQLRVAQAEKWKQLRMIEELESKLRGFGHDVGDLGDLSLGGSPSSQIIHSLQQDKDRQAKEYLLLRKTIEEMELRIETQKQTLQAREESIKKLLEMLQNKGMSMAHMGEDRQEIERCKLHVAEAERRVLQLEAMLEQRDNEIDRLRQNSRSGEEINATVRIRELQNETLELEVKKLQAEVKRLRLEGATNSDMGDQLELLKQEEKDLRKKNDALKSNILRKEKELSTVRSQVDILEKQNKDQTQHITLLQNQIGAKDSQISLLQTEAGELRKNLMEKTSQNDHRASEVAALSSNKRQVDTQVTQLMETLDIKDRKISVLQRKIEKLEESLLDTEKQLTTARSRLTTIQSSDSTVSSLQITITQQQETIDRLTESRRKTEEEHRREIDELQATKLEIATQLTQLQHQLDQKQSSERKLQETFGDMKTSTHRQELEVRKLKEEIARKTQETASVQQQLLALQQQHATAQERHNSMQQQLTNTQQQHHSIQQQYTALQQQHAALQTQLDRQRDESARKSPEIASLQQQLRQQRDEIAKKSQEVLALQQQSAKLRDDLAKTTQELTNLQKLHSQSLDELKQLKASSSERSEEIKDLKQKLDQASQEIQKLHHNLKQHSEEKNSTQTQSSQQAREIQQLRIESQEKSDEIKKLIFEITQKEEATKKMRADVEKKVGEEIGKLNSEISKRTEDAKKYRAQAEAKAVEVEQIKKQLAQVEKDKQRSLDQLGTEATKQADRLRQESNKFKEEATRSQAEMDRLLLILQETENEKRTMDQQIKKMQGQLKQHEEASNESSQSKAIQNHSKFSRWKKQSSGEEWKDRIAELEEALRESVKITAQRELVLAQQQDHIDMAEKQIEYLKDELERHKEHETANEEKVDHLQQQINARDKQLKFLQGDRGKQMRELYEMKQEALSAAITEKDAHIALLEIAPNKRTENIDAVERLTFEKIKLQQQLKDLTEKRMKLLGLEEESKSNGTR